MEQKLNFNLKTIKKNSLQNKQVKNFSKNFFRGTLKNGKKK